MQPTEPNAPADHPAATLEGWRSQGLDRVDPLRFHHLSVLAARLPGQPPAVQRVLVQRLAEAMVAYAGACKATCQGAGFATLGAAQAQAPVPSPPKPSPLAALNHELAQRHAAGMADDVGRSPGSGWGADQPQTDLQSMRRFGEVWARMSAQQQVDRALDRGPENAGPLNSHRLMLRTLTLMRTLSPDYLRRFLSQVDALLWLEQSPVSPGSTRAPLRKPGRSVRRGPGSAGGR